MKGANEILDGVFKQSQMEALIEAALHLKEVLGIPVGEAMRIILEYERNTIIGNYGHEIANKLQEILNTHNQTINN